MIRERDSSREHNRILEVLQATYGKRYRWQVLGLVLRKYLLRIRAERFFCIKRGFDMAISFVLLLLLAPLFLLLIILIRRDGGPAFYRQIRIGRHGKPFHFWKFRSMVPNAHQLKSKMLANNEMRGGVLFKIKDDPRVTRLGRWMRKLSLDELPQLWNVLRGNMTLVGPRPPLPEEVRLYNARERRRLEAEQGITCSWQVSGRNQIGFEDQVELDLEYIQNESIWNDLKLLLKTLPAVISGRGAS